MFERRLAKLCGELRGGIVQEIAVLTKDVSVRGTALLCLVWVPVVLGLWLRLRWGRW